jgi:DNA-binding MarR family transcriptional regulator
MAKSNLGQEPESAFPVAAAGSDARAAQLLNHPNFAKAVRLYVRMTLDACRQDLAVTKLFGNTTQHVAFSLIATLSARAAQIEGAPPLTSTRLIAEIAGMGFSAHGKIETLINRMIDQGLIERKRWADDGRVKLLQPTDAFLAMDSVLNMMHAAPAALLSDDPLVHAIAAGDRRAMRLMRSAAMPNVEEAGAMLQRAPAIALFVMSEAGWLILLTLVDAIWRDDVRGRRFEAIAKSCAVTRPHVRNLFLNARDQGLLHETAPGIFLLAPDFVHVFEAWLAEVLAAFIGCCQRSQAAPVAAAA